MFLEDGEWASANAYCEQVLDMNPECSQAYLLKLLAELELHNVDDLVSAEQDFEDSDNYKKAIRFGDKQTVLILQTACDCVNQSIAEKKYNKIYVQAQQQQELDTIEALHGALELYKSILEWNDSKQRYEQCEFRIKEINNVKAEEKKERKSKVKKVCTIGAIACIVVALAFFVARSMYRSNQYGKAHETYLKGNLQGSLQIYEKLGTYKDSADKVIEIETQIEEQKEAKTERERFGTANIGDYVDFGRYDQSADYKDGKEPVDWKVLDKKDGKLLLCSKYALYACYMDGTTWENSVVRKWLQGEFYEELLSCDEQQMVAPIMNKNIAYQEAGSVYYKKYEVEPTEDTIFLLSAEEYEKYGVQLCKLTESTQKYYPYDTVMCWLRTVGNPYENYDKSTDCFCFVGSDGIDEDGDNEYAYYAIQPAVWVSVE